MGFSVPVVMFHSVADDRPDRPKSFNLYNGVAEFERCLAYLRQNRWTTIDLRDLRSFLADGKTVPSRSIVLTFDDAYLDNWVVVAPLLRKYGFSGTVFVPTDFIQAGTTPRPTLEDVWAGRVAETELEMFGYVNRSELKILAESGVLDVQSHARSHTWLPSADSLETFHHPRLPLRRHLRWMWWNRNPTAKPYWFEKIRHEDIPWGVPVFQSDLALAGRAFVPHPELEPHIVRHVADRGGASFFEQPDWHSRLTAEVESFRREAGPTAVPETDEKFQERLRYEIEGSRSILESLTGRPVEFLCWPNGGVCAEALRVARECGYLSTTIPSWIRRGGNRIGDPSEEIKRISSTPYFHGKSLWPKTLSFALKVKRARGEALMEIPIKLIWLMRKLIPVRRPAQPET